MKKGGIFAVALLASVFFTCTGSLIHAGELKHDAKAAKHLESIRKNLSTLPEMKYKDAKPHYTNSLKELNSLIADYTGTEEALQAQFYIGAIHNQMFNFDEAIKCFDEILKHGDIDPNFKARTYFFMAKAYVGKGDIANAKEAVAELRLIEPMAADSFTSELSGMVRVGMEAPPFSATDINGTSIDLSKSKGTITILFFWATWCEPCIQEFTKVKNLYSLFNGRGVKFIGISLDDDIGDLKGFVKQEEIDWPQLFDGKRWKGTLPALYHVQAIPTMFILDKENKVRYIGNEVESISRIITTLLSESEEVPLFR